MMRSIWREEGTRALAPGFFADGSQNFGFRSGQPDIVRMLSRIARGVPRFLITSGALSLSTRFSSLPKLDLASQAEITMPSLGAFWSFGMNSSSSLNCHYTFVCHGE